ncbi:MAG TPA: hypothetical protein VKB39_04805, partial [Candidatus Baltobacteraceae bacterium]|nr:hypothetical protein [Candidatus Baltobacteraceae bacterium]
ILYLVLAIAAIIFAMREPPDALGRARAILLPVAFVTLGGTYLHHQQISVALPAAIIVIPCVRTTTQRILLSMAFIGLLFTPGAIDSTRESILTYVAACGAVAAWIWPKRRLPAFVIAAAVAGALVLGTSALPKANSQRTAFSVPPISEPLDRPSNKEWTDFLAASPSLNSEDLNSIGSKLPAWCALISLVVVVVLTQQRVTRQYVTFGVARANA